MLYVWWFFREKDISWFSLIFCQNFEQNFHHIVLNIIFISYLEQGSESPNEDSPSTDRLRFDRFDICRLLKHGASLLGSAGAEFEVQDDKSGIYILLADKKTHWLEKVRCGSIMNLDIHGFSEC